MDFNLTASVSSLTSCIPSVPGLQNAQVATQMQQTLATLNGTLEALSTIALTSDGTVEHITHSAQTLLSRYFQPVFLQGDRLPEALHIWVKHRIAHLSSSGHPSGELPSPCLPLQIEHLRDRLTIRLILVPQSAQCLLLLEENPCPVLSGETLELLGLTKREAEVLGGIIQGQDIAAIAIDLGICDRTVKKHLEHIHEKIGGKTRLAVVMNALTKLGLINPIAPTRYV